MSTESPNTTITTNTEKTAQELRVLGNEKFRSMNYGAALMFYTQAIDKDPENFAIYYNRAVTFVKMDAMEESKADLLTSLRINPDYIPSLLQIGFLYLYEGNTPDSLESYVKVVKLNERLPNQLNRFKAQLKEAIRLAESRCKQQDYPQDFIDSIITPDVRAILESYPNLPTHMIESGIPPVAFGNVPISHQFENRSAVLARASIPIPVSGLRTSATTFPPASTTTTTTNANATGTTENTNNTPDIANMLNIPGLLSTLNNTPGVSASVSIGGPQSPAELLSALGNFNNTNPTTVTTARSNANTTTTSTTPTIIHAPISHTATGLPTDVLQRHREAHQAAVNRATELRRQREHDLQTNNASTHTDANATNSPSVPSVPSALSVPSVPSVSSVPDSTTPTSATSATSATPATPAPANASNATTNTTATATTTTNGTGNDFARQFANTIATQLTNAANQHATQVGPDATPNNGAIQSLAQNLTSIASGVLGSLSNGNNFVSMIGTPSNTNNTSNNTNNNNNNNNSGNNASNSGSHGLDADLDMDLD